MARKLKIKKQVGIGVCSEQYRPQQFARKDPYDFIPFDDNSLSEAFIRTMTSLFIGCGVGAFICAVAYWVWRFVS